MPRGEGLPADDLDLQPGWRLEVITPILKSGGFQLHTTTAESEPGNLNVVAGPDFIGYESSYYDVRRKKNEDVTIDFRSAQLHRDAKVVREPQPRFELFHIPASARYVRLMYLMRISKADHDMAVVSANNIGELEAVTNALGADPVYGCTAPNCY